MGIIVGISIGFSGLCVGKATKSWWLGIGTTAALFAIVAAIFIQRGI